MEGLLVARLVVGDAVGPAAVEDPYPLVGEGADDRPVADLSGALRVVVGARPPGLEKGLPDPFDEGLMFEVLAGALGEAAVDVALLAALSLVPRALQTGFALGVGQCLVTGAMPE